MSEEKWDRESNILTEDEIKEEQNRLLWERIEENTRARELQRQMETINYMEPPDVPAREVAALLPYHDERIRIEGSEEDQYTRITYDLAYYESHPEEIYSPWWANKIWTICHNCGSVGFKYGRIRKTWKCYGCRSRNVQLVRAADLSRILREHRDVGVFMEDVYNARQEENRARRAERSARRRNAERAS